MKTRLVVIPAVVPANSSVLIQHSDALFPDKQYSVTTENGDVVRRGTIQDTGRDFSFSVGGMADGSYYFVIGDNKERFTVV